MNAHDDTARRGDANEADGANEPRLRLSCPRLLAILHSWSDNRSISAHLYSLPIMAGMSGTLSAIGIYIPVPR